MTWYEIFKDILDLVNSAKDALLYNKLMELRQCVSQMQYEIDKLKDENRDYLDKIRELEKIKITEDDIEHHPDKGYITLKSDNQKIKYCGVCWAKSKLLIPIGNVDMGHLGCGNCGTKFEADVSSSKYECITGGRIDSDFF